MVVRHALVSASLAAIALAGCGRIGFAERARAGDDGGGDDDDAVHRDAPTGDAVNSSISLVAVSPYNAWSNATNETLPIALPAGLQDGDVLLLYATWAENLGNWTGPPSGWSNVVAPWTDPRCANSGSALYTATAQAGTASPATGTCNGFCIATIIAFRGVDPVTPFDAIGPQGTTSETQTCRTDLTPQLQVVPGLTTTTDGDWIVLLYGDNNDDEIGGSPSTQTLPSGFATLFNELGPADASENFLAGSLGPIAAGPVADQTVTSTFENLFGFTAIMIALKPAS